MEIKRKRGRPCVKKQLDREQLLHLALKAFSREGFEGVKLSLLAQEAGIANSLLNYYFESKEDLWQQAARYGFGQLEAKLNQVFRHFKDLEGIPLLKVLTRQFVYFVAEFPEYYRGFSREMAEKSERADWLMEHLFLPFQEKVDQTYRKEQEAGNLKKLPIPNLSLISMGAANMFFSYRYFIQSKYDCDPFDQSQIEQHADTVIEVLFNGMIERSAVF